MTNRCDIEITAEIDSEQNTECLNYHIDCDSHIDSEDIAISHID